MKKNVAILLLFVIMITCVFAINTICFADEIKDNSTYREATQDITCYKTSDTSSPVIIIPKTYYFKITGQNESFYEILYNNNKFYCLREAIDTYTKKTDLTDITTPYYFLSISDKENQVTVYNPQTFESTGSLLLTDVYFIGYYVNEDVYYFYISANMPGVDNKNNFFVKADDYSLNFSSKNINLHPNSAELRKQEAQLSTKVAQNKLKRNIFFAVICFLCVVLVCVIYNPFKKKVLPQNHTSYTSEDDF